MPRQALLVSLCCLLLPLTSAVGDIREPSVDPPTAGESPHLGFALGDLSLPFIENRGQLGHRVAYSLQGTGASAYFTPAGVMMALTAPRSASPDSVSRWWLELRFVGADKVRPVGSGVTPTIVSYFTGQRDSWTTGVPTYRSLIYPDLWPGIDLRFEGTQSQLEYTFVVHPGADPGSIRLAYRGAPEVRLNGAGGIEVATPLGTLHDEAPHSFQAVEGRRLEVSTAYAVKRTDVHGAHVFGFRVGDYDRAHTLTIDPTIIVYAGYLGGAGYDAGFAVAVDDDGNAYVAGSTGSTETSFPVAVGPDMTYNGGTQDVFVAKIDRTGATIDYIGYIGGDAQDTGTGVAVDGAGNAYVVGRTGSTQATFPVLVGPDLTYNGGAFDAFVAKIDSTGASLDYAGYVGGSGDDFGESVAVESSGTAYMAGSTGSTEASFPVSVGPDLTFNGGPADAFVAKVSGTGAGLVYAGYVGGVGGDGASGIAVDGGGNAYLTGSAGSDQASFPVLGGPDLTFNGGVVDGFVAKVDRSGATLDYAGFIGGAGGDGGFDVAVDPSGHAFVAGITDSSETTFPVAVGPDLTHNGLRDAFVARVSSSGTALDYAGYVGGTAEDLGLGVAIDAGGNAYVTGWTASTETTFPVESGPDLTYNGGSADVFVAKVDPTGGGLSYAGYVGGAGNDGGIFPYGAGIAVDAAGDAYVTSSTTSSETTFPVSVGPDLSYNSGFSDAFVAKIAVLQECEHAVPTIFGGPSDDTLMGTSGPDVIAGYGGDDVIYGLGGGDVLCGFDGQDQLFGGGGNDLIATGEGSNTVKGGGGNDRIRGGVGNDALSGGSGADVAFGSAGDDALDGGPGNDRLTGGTGIDFADGGPGNDVCSAESTVQC